MKVSMSSILTGAKECHYAVPAMNYIDFSTARAYSSVSEKRQLPLILAFAQSHSKWLSLEEAAMIGRYFQETTKTPIVLHLDHGQDIDFIKKAIHLGFNSVMIDASQNSLEENIRKTKEVVDYARKKHVEVEAEIGFVGSNAGHDSSGIGSIYTDLEEAKIFYEQTHVNSLAVSIGTAHGIYQGEPNINFKRLEEIENALPIPLVLHGGSSSGDQNLSLCAQKGISKINIFSDVIAEAYKYREDDIVKDYPSLISTMELAMENTLNHYYDVFYTQKGFDK